MYLYGASGHCKVIIDAIKKSKQFLIKGIFDDNPKFESIFDIPVFKTENLDFFEHKQLIICIGDNIIRKKIVEKIAANYIKVVHPCAIISLDVEIKDGTVVMAGATINASTNIGSHCIINTGAVIEHDCTIENFVHISPNVSLAGNVIVGEGSQIGIGACVIQGIKVGKWAIVGAGSVIINDVPDHAVVVGNPGRIIKYNNTND